MDNYRQLKKEFYFALNNEKILRTVVQNVLPLNEISFSGLKHLNVKWKLKYLVSNRVVPGYV